MEPAKFPGAPPPGANLPPPGMAVPPPSYYEASGAAGAQAGYSVPPGGYPMGSAGPPGSYPTAPQGSYPTAPPGSYPTAPPGSYPTAPQGGYPSAPPMGYQMPPGGGYAPVPTVVQPGTTVVVVAQPLFSNRPVNANCPHCAQNVLTVTHMHTGALTWLVCLLLCFLCPIIFFLPFCIDGLKDVEHRCPNCRATIGRYTRL